MPHVKAAAGHRWVQIDNGVTVFPGSSINVDITLPLAAAALSAGSITQVDATAAPSGSTYPNTPDLWQRSVPFLTPPDRLYNAATWTRAQGPNNFYGIVAYNATALANDGAAFQVNLTKGTWSMTLSGQKAANQGIVTVDISYDNGATWTTISAIDTYAAATATAFWDFANIVVPKTCVALVRFRVLTKNASASSFVMGLSGMNWTRTS